jgi:hypothetical protein
VLLLVFDSNTASELVSFVYWCILTEAVSKADVLMIAGISASLQPINV